MKRKWDVKEIIRENRRKQQEEREVRTIERTSKTEFQHNGKPVVWNYYGEPTSEVK